MILEDLTSEGTDSRSDLVLDDGSRVAVIGGGPAGSFFTYFLLRMADRVGVVPQVDIYERKSFSRQGSPGCNHCGGIVSESLVQLLATEGINLPSSVVQRGIDSYVLHTDVGSVRIATPGDEKRIAAMYRGSGPRGEGATDWESFDSFLLELAVEKGARLVSDRVVEVGRDDGKLRLQTKGGESRVYDLVVGAMGVNSSSADLFEGLGIEYSPPGVTRTFICEYFMGRRRVREHFGDSMHVFLLNIPRLKFGALIPKGRHVTMCLLGEGIDKELVLEFQSSPEVSRCFPPDVQPRKMAPCKCSPKINVRGAVRPFADGLLLLGDAAVTRLYKDGIGAAYVAAKAAAATVALQGFSKEDFRRHYWPALKGISTDNAIGKVIFAVTRLIQSREITKRGILRMVENEQENGDARKLMSSVMWDTFTGSASYRDILRRTLSPEFIFSLARQTATSFLFDRRRPR
ncbi:MAG: NAD(P)/FAD-dependent oxidoreductase [Planctomycetota bacterium]|jgi:flavin-dependent dehydrogenase